MNRSMTRSAAVFLGLLVLAGCARYTPEDVTQQTPPAATVPATLFVSSPPGTAVPLIEAKSSAKQGDRVVFEARVGGRRDAFVENRAVFFVADPALLSCDQIHGDTCRTPWDYCCEPRDNLLKNMATVQVLGPDGRPLAVSLEDHRGLAPLRTVLVSGTVDEVDESGTFVVNADSIYVKEG